jgi:cell division protein FtsB
VTPAATAAAGARARRSARAEALPRRVAPQRPRRVSGPARHAAPALAPPLGARLVRGAGQLVDHRLLDRLIRGRAWIGLVAFALIGIVAMQVALLKLNTGVSRSIERAATLQQQNTALEAQISTLASGDRITTAAGSLGMVYPPAGDVAYLSALRGDAVRASRALAAGLAQPLVAVGAPAATANTASTSSVLTPASSGAGSSGTTSQVAAAPSTSTPPPVSAGGAVSGSAGAASGAAPASSGAAGGAAPDGAGGAGIGTAASAGSGGGPAAGSAGAAAYPGSTGKR